MVIQSYNKTLVSLVMGILLILQQFFGLHVGFLTEEYVAMVIAVIWPILVWWIPNDTGRLR